MTQNFWTSERIELLKNNYKLPREELLKLFPVSWSIISRMINYLGLYRRGVPWEQSEDNILHEEYFLTPTKLLAEKLCRSIPAIHQRATLLGLIKSHQVYRKGSANILLDGSLISAYWIGFLLADGWISRSNRLKLSISQVDINNLEKFAEYIGTTVKTFVTNKGHPMCYTALQDADNIPKLRERFGFHNKKTYNPPTVPFGVSPNELIALIIGFIDGDGNINTRGHIRIKCHSSWIGVLEYFSVTLQKYFNLPLNGRASYINAQGYASCNISFVSLTKELYNFAIQHKLPILDRKWDRVKMISTNYQRITPQQRDTIRTLIDQNFSSRQIAKIVGCTKTTVLNYARLFRQNG